MPKVSELKPGACTKALVFGPPKAGKTFFAGTWPKPGFVDLDYGIKVLATQAFKSKHPKADDAEYAQFTDEVNDKGIALSPKAFWDALAYTNKLIADPEIETIVIDSLTSLSTLARNVGLAANAKGRRSQTLTDAKINGLVLMTMQDFGAEMSAIEQFIDQLVSVDKHVLVLAHEKAETNDTGIVLSVGPLITGDRLRAKIARWFDDVWYMEATGEGEKRKHVLVTASDKKRKTVGSRLGLPPEIEDPSYQKIQKLLKGG